MADVKISELNELTASAADDLIPLVDTSATETKYAEAQSLLASISPAICSPPVVSYSAASTLIFGAAAFPHLGTKYQLIQWASALTFTFGSSGSNSDSEDLVADEIFYVYIDDSAVVTLGDHVITEAQLVANTTVPTWSGAKKGFYNGLDRCIFAIPTDASGNLLQIEHGGGDYVGLVSDQADFYGALTASFASKTLLSVPAFGSFSDFQAYCQLSSSGTGNREVYARAYGTTGSSGKRVVGNIGAASTTTRSENSMRLTAGNDAGVSKINLQMDALDTNATFLLRVQGYYLPRGMGY